MLSRTTIIILLTAALLACFYMLRIMWQIHKLHSSIAWRFIFFGLTLLTLECAMAIYLTLVPESKWSGVLQSLFVLTMVSKAFSYSIGFTIWRGNINGLKRLASKAVLIDEEARKIADDQFKKGSEINER